MQTAPPVPDVRPRRLATKILIGVAVGVTLLMCGTAIFGAYLWWTGGADIPAVKATTDRYLGLIEAGDDAGAYQLLCHNDQVTMTTAAFTAAVRKAPRPTRHTIGTVHVRDE